MPCRRCFHRFVKFSCSADRVGQARSASVTPVTPDQIDGIGFTHIELGIIDRAYRARVDQRDQYVLVSDFQRQFVGRILEAELECQMLFRIADVIDVDFIQPVLVELVKIGTALRVLEGDVIGDERDVILSTRLITSKHVQVSAVNLRLIAYEGRFPVARRSGWHCVHERERASNRRSTNNISSGKAGHDDS